MVRYCGLRREACGWLIKTARLFQPVLLHNNCTETEHHAGITRNVRTETRFSSSMPRGSATRFLSIYFYSANFSGGEECITLCNKMGAISAGLKKRERTSYLLASLQVSSKDYSLLPPPHPTHTHVTPSPLLASHPWGCSTQISHLHDQRNRRLLN